MTNTVVEELLVIILVFTAWCVTVHFFYRNSVRTMLEEIGTKFDLYPKHYSMPPRWMRKYFKLKKKKIPKFLIFRLYVAAAVLIIIPIAILACLVSELDKSVVLWFQALMSAFGILDTAVFLIVGAIFSRYK